MPAALTFDGAEAPGRAAMLAHGERLSHIVGCTGCHTATLEGKLFNEDAPELGKLYASNLTRVMPTMSDAQLEALLRTGKHPTRGDMWIMPSEIFQRLSDADMKALIAHLRTVKPSGEATPPPALSELAQKLVADGKLKPTSGYIAEYRDKLPPDLGADHALRALPCRGDLRRMSWRGPDRQSRVRAGDRRCPTSTSSGPIRTRR